VTTGVDFRSPGSNRRASSLLGATASPGMSAVYSAHYSAKKNPLNPKQRPVRISARRTLAKSLDIADARSPSKLSDPEINAAPADDLAERPLKESVSDSGDGRESIISEDDHDDHNGDDRQDDHNDRGRRRTNVSPPQPFKGKGKDPSIDWRRGASLLDDDEEKPRAPLKTLIGSNESIIKLSRPDSHVLPTTIQLDYFKVQLSHYCGWRRTPFINLLSGWLLIGSVLRDLTVTDVKTVAKFKPY
jgi:hypothetical protein